MNKTEVSMTTDFINDRGLAEQAIELSARAGFTHIHWCHHWNDDFFYTEPEIEYIKDLLETNNIKLSDTHGSHSHSGEKCWYSTNETFRKAGVELVKNRIDFTYRLGGDSVVVHGPNTHQPLSDFEPQVAALNTSLDELERFSRDRGIKLAIENSNSNYKALLLPVILHRPVEYLGFCYDCGHHNMKIVHETPEQRSARDKMRDELAERLVIVHLQDNNGFADSHWIPFKGVMDWEDVVAFLKLADYRKPLNLEISYNNTSRLEPMSHEEFVSASYEAAVKLTDMLRSR